MIPVKVPNFLIFPIIPIILIIPVKIEIIGIIEIIIEKIRISKILDNTQHKIGEYRIV